MPGCPGKVRIDGRASWAISLEQHVPGTAGSAQRLLRLKTRPKPARTLTDETLLVNLKQSFENGVVVPQCDCYQASTAAARARNTASRTLSGADARATAPASTATATASACAKKAGAGQSGQRAAVA